MIPFSLDPRGAHGGRDFNPQSHHAHSCATTKPWSQSEQSTDWAHGTVTLCQSLWYNTFMLASNKDLKFLPGFKILISSNLSPPQELSKLIVSRSFFHYDCRFWCKLGDNLENTLILCSCKKGGVGDKWDGWYNSHVSMLKWRYGQLLVSLAEHK